MRNTFITYNSYDIVVKDCNVCLMTKANVICKKQRKRLEFSSDGNITTGSTATGQNSH